MKSLVDWKNLPTFAAEIIDVLECTSYIYINGGYNRAGFQHVIRHMRAEPLLPREIPLSPLKTT